MRDHSRLRRDQIPEAVRGIVPAAPSVTIAPRNPARGVLLFVVTLTTYRVVRSYPCRTPEKATDLARRFISGFTKPARRSAPEQPELQPAPAQPVTA